MSNVPLVSVIMPTRNRTFCICEAVQRVLDQTHPRVECIVVDDGSTDDTLGVLDAAFVGDPRVPVLSQQPAGVSAARNQGLARVSGSFVSFLDSDI
jgi:glycosyltransferase involved in cell wall biosynthesis